MAQILRPTSHTVACNVQEPNNKENVMKKFIFTRPEDNGIELLVPSPKEGIEQHLGKLTDEEYERHVWKMAIPENALNPRYIEDEDIPLDHIDFRNAWCDVTPASRIDIDCCKARDIQLEILRENRKEAFNKLGVPNKFNKEIEDSILSPETRLELEKLRNITEPLKALDVKGKFNDEHLLNEIKRLGAL